MESRLQIDESTDTYESLEDGYKDNYTTHEVEQMVNSCPFTHLPSTPMGVYTTHTEISSSEESETVDFNNTQIGVLAFPMQPKSLPKSATNVPFTISSGFINNLEESSGEFNLESVALTPNAQTEYGVHCSGDHVELSESPFKEISGLR